MYATSVNPSFCVSIEKAVKAENRLVDQNSKVVPNDPQMVWDEFGDVFSVFATFFGWFYPPFIVKNAYSGHFGVISRDFGLFLAIYYGSTI